MAERWALAYANSLDKKSAEAAAALRALEEGLAFLTLLSASIKKAPGMISGKTTAAHIERLVRASLAHGADAVPLEQRIMEISLRFFTLIIERKCFAHIDAILEAVKRLIDRRKGVLSVTLEYADERSGTVGVFTQQLTSLLQQKASVQEVRITFKKTPELLGGYRLLIGSVLLDASVKTMLAKLASTLSGGLQW
ncbi:F0F1 ATP synthase subunit delta [Breznakiellaceae bacterium SP9]